MPNAKLYVEHSRLATVGPALVESLGALKRLLCEGFDVPPEQCHIAIVGVRNSPGDPELNLELVALKKPERTPQVVDRVCRAARDLLVEIAGVPVAVRCLLFDQDEYIRVK